MSLIDTGRVFEIYSIGDGLFMRRVIDSVAAMSNAGLLMQLVGLSMMIGLLIMGFRNVIHGGNKLDLGATFVSLILGFIMFGMTADVVIHDMNFAPGENDNPAYAVANVPFGVAATGYIVSGIGYELTLSMEQGYGLYAGGRSSLIEGGFGNTLEWINAMRMWEVPSFSDESGTVSNFKNNLASYMESCVKPAIEMNHLRLDWILSTKTLWTYGTAVGPGTGGIGYGSEYLMVEFEAADGTKATVTCNAGFQLLDAVRPSVFPAYADALALKNINMSTGGMDTAAKLNEAYAAIGFTTSQMQNLVVAELVGLSLENAIAGKTTSAALASQSKMMVEQAAMQRSIQWAAEETMFRRIMRPMMAFFESLMYALAPFMALAIGLGQFGLQTIGKYLMLSIWVVLWLPMLSIIELYQMTMMQHAVNAMMKGIEGHGAGAGVSIATADAVRASAIEWLGAGAAMAAFTPALTLAVVWGGAITASALAGQMRGGDTINEKMTTPDVAGTPAATGVQSNYGYSAGGGTAQSGSVIPSISMKQVSGTAISSTAAEQQANSQSVAKEVSQIMSSSMSATDRMAAMQGFRETGFTQAGVAAEVGKSREVANGTNAGATRTEAEGSTAASAVNTSAGGQFGIKVPIPGKGGSGNANNGGGGGGGDKGGVQLPGFMLGGEASNTDTNTRAGGHQTARGSTSSDTEKGNTSLKATNANGERIEDYIAKQASQDVSWAKQLQDSMKKSGTWQASQSASQAYQSAASSGNEFGSSEAKPANVVAQQAIEKGNGGAVVSALLGQQGGAAMMAIAKADLGNTIPPGQQKDVAAAALALSGHYDNRAADGWDTSSKGKGAHANALVGALSGDSQAQSSGFGSVGADAFKGVGGATTDPNFAAKNGITEAPSGPNFNAGALTDHVTSTLAAGSGADPSRHFTGANSNEVGGNPAAFAEGQGQVMLNNLSADGVDTVASAAEANEGSTQDAQQMQQRLEGAAEGTPLSISTALTGGAGNTMQQMAATSLGNGVGGSNSELEGHVAAAAAQYPNLSSDQHTVIGTAKAHNTADAFNALSKQQINAGAEAFDRLSPEQQAVTKPLISEYSGNQADVADLRAQADNLRSPPESNGSGGNVVIGVVNKAE